MMLTMKPPFVGLGALWIGTFIHVDWHLDRPGHDHLSFGLPPVQHLSRIRFTGPFLQSSCQRV